MRSSSEQPWTTSRCNRLLRPISSRIATLKKELEFQQKAGETRRPTNASLAGPTSQPRPRKPQCFDPEWVPTAKAPGKRTYGRGGRRSNPSNAPSTAPGTQPGQIAGTPFIAHSTPLFSSPDLHNTPLRHRGKGPLIARVQKIKDLKKHMAPDIGKLIEGLLDAYGKLLQATCPNVEKNRIGARSLMSTCLQNMPRYIALEEHFAELDAEEAEEVMSRDLTDEVYTHLEQTFAVGEGWPHFKEMIRAHGTSLICDAVDDGLLGLDALHAVVELCMKASAWQEAEKFLWTYLPLLKPLPTPPTLGTDLFSETSVYMYLVMDLVKSTGRTGFLFDILEHLIFYDLLPLEWLASDRVKQVVWWRLERTLAKGDERWFGHAIRFLETALLATMGLSDDSMAEEGDCGSQLKPSVRQTLRDALDNTTSNILTLLTSSALACRDHDIQNSTSQRLTWVLDYIVTGLLSRRDFRRNLELLDATDQDMQTFAQRALWTVTASVTVHLGCCSPGPGLHCLDSGVLLQSFHWLISQYPSAGIDVPAALSTLPPFISSIARFAGKVGKGNGFDQLQSLITALLSHSSLRLPHKLWNIQRLALETCQEFAQSSNDSAHFAYARQIEDLMRKTGRVMLVRSPQKGETPSAGRGWRLEEGIGEWVACTPLVKEDANSRRRRRERDDRTHLPSPASSVSPSEEDDGPARGRRDHPTRGGKRPRADSPRVVIPYKRVRLAAESVYVSSTRHDSFIASPTASEGRSPVSCAETGLRRSRRTKPQSRNTQSGLWGGMRKGSLRNVAPKSYAEVEEEEEEERESGPPSDSDVDSGDSLTSTNEDEDEDQGDNDELVQTPARMRRSTSARTTRMNTRSAARGRNPKDVTVTCKKQTGQWRCAGRQRRSLLLAKKHFQEEDSEDELSFC